MKNSDFIERVIRCKDCIHRRTWLCFMTHYIQDIGEWIDYTEDNMFCSEGEKE